MGLPYEAILKLAPNYRPKGTVIEGEIVMEQYKPRVVLLDPEIVTMGSAIVLEGLAYGHPRFENGTRVQTTVVQRGNMESNTVETLNTVYILAKPKLLRSIVPPFSPPPPPPPLPGPTL